MKYNVGPVDRMARIVIGLIIAIVGVLFDSWLGLIGLIPLATALFGICPLYLPFKISTSKKK